jgi:hypothetical protein
VETNPSNIRKHPYFPYGHPFLLPRGTTLTAFDTNVSRENTDVRWVGFHPPYLPAQTIWSLMEAHKASLPHPPHTDHWVCSEKQAISLASLALLVKGKHPPYLNK